MRLPETRRRDAAERAFAGDPEFLRELLHLLECAETTELFLVPPSTRGAGAEAPPEPAGRRGQLVGRRWRLVRRVGSGGQGVVWEAQDSVAGGRAAVKLIRRPAAAQAARIGREAAALRWLRLPGVVRLLDDGSEGGVFWLAMEYVEGDPFPGRGRAGDWNRLEPVAVGLLEALARIHGAGVVHGDLKPHTVLVDARGVVTVLDLGLAAALAGEAAERPRGGTPGYAAPERGGGAAPDVRSDLYSLGVLLFKALAGRPPRRDGLDAVPRDGVPRRVRALISRLLAPDPRGRPASAADALRSLRSRSTSRRARTWSERELRGRFRGHDWFHHLREDAARELFRRTRGEPARVEAELASWMRAGLARLEDGLVEIDRVALERLPDLPDAEGRTPRRVRRGPGAGADAELSAALRDGDPRRVAAAALRAGQAALDEGRAVRALSALELGAAAAQGLRGGAALRRVLLLAARAALATATAREIERALWLVGRAGRDDGHTAALTDVLRAAAASQAGDRAAAWKLSSGAARRGPRQTRQLAWTVRALVAQSLDLRIQRRAVAEAARWARQERSTSARRACRTWRAWLLYREGRCAQAAGLHLRNARAAASPAESSRSFLDASVAATDAGNSAAGITMARAARRHAAALRLPVQEARAFLTERAAQAAQGVRLRPSLAALRAIDEFGFGAMTWSARMTEATIAWRRGDLALAREILAPLATGGDPSRLALWEVPVACLAVALGARCGPGRAHALARRAVRETAPPVAAQCLALLALGGGAGRAALRRHLDRLRLPTRGDDFTRLREFLSIRDAAAVFEG